MNDKHHTGHIFQALAVNLVIALGKGVAAFFTGSGALLAETIHTGADCGNQLVLLLGVKSSQKPPSETHPLGHGRALYFWSFIVALFLFVGGGVFSVYEGIHKLESPEPITLVGVGFGILIFSLLLEGGSTIANIKEMNRRRGTLSFARYLKSTKDSDLIVVFGENAAASVGLVVAILSLFASWITGDPVWDAWGSLAIGFVLIGVAVFLAIEVKSLLIGESGDPSIRRAVEELLPHHPHMTKLLHLITVQQGPGQVVLMMKIGFKSDLDVGSVCDAINNFEGALRAKCSEVRWCFIEPDRPRE